MRSYNCCILMLVFMLFAFFIHQGKCQVQNENSQIPNSANKSSKYNIWGRDWMNWAEGVNGPAGGVKPKWFQIADRYMTNFMNNNAANGTSSQGGFFTKLFDKISNKKKDKKNKSKDTVA